MLEMGSLKVPQELYQKRCERLSRFLALDAPACIVRTAADLVVRSVAGPGWRHRVDCQFIMRAPRWMLMCFPSSRKIVQDLEYLEKEELDAAGKP